MCEHLSKRGATYYFRRQVPERLRSYILTRTGAPRTEWMITLKTKDRAEAKRLLRPYQTMTDQLIADAEKTSAEPTKPLAVAASMSSAESHARYEAYQRQQFEDMEAEERINDEHEWRLETDPIYAATIELKAETAKLRQADEDRKDAQELKAQARAANKMPLLTLYERYAAIPGRHPKTIAQWRPYIKKLADFMGTDEARDVTRKKLIEWRNHLRDEVTFRGKRLGAKTINDSYL